jgi:3-hydroxymyristoyl/3-hydroxydecanoyl-(acyl carrier protein) dehydratase
MPVVPAVVLIEQLARSLEEQTGQRVCSIRQLRLLGLIEPGQRIDVEVREKRGGQLASDLSGCR